MKKQMIDIPVQPVSVPLNGNEPLQAPPTSLAVRGPEDRLSREAEIWTDSLQYFSFEFDLMMININFF